ncbi:HDIG domain-containing metalloprotein [Actinoplanes sp. NPDC024001]|uniref:HDIG domain-containing metalloprotein n=1 Tax=Actinoplanes sp. NPDC024001 TaxID=3154598 RepID=UPI0033EEE662
MGIPTDRQIRAWHERFAPSRAAFELVHTHCEIVCAVAEELFTDGDLELVRAGCLLHDIGVYRLRESDHYIRHGVLGEELLRELGLPEELVRFCSHHTGVGLTRDDVLRQGLPLPAGDYVAETDEEHLVMYADKFHSKSSPPAFVSADSYARRVARFGADNVDRFAALRARYGEPNLAALAKRYGHAIV